LATYKHCKITKVKIYRKSFFSRKLKTYNRNRWGRI